MLYSTLYPEKAGELTNKESGYISELLTLAGLESGKNVLVDGSLRDSAWYQFYFQKLRTDYPNLKIAILHVVAPREAVFQRAAVSCVPRAKGNIEQYVVWVYLSFVVARPYSCYQFVLIVRLTRTEPSRPVESSP